MPGSVCSHNNHLLSPSQIQNDGSGNAYKMVQLPKQWCALNSGILKLPVDLYRKTATSTSVVR